MYWTGGSGVPCVLVGLKAKASDFLPAPDAAALLMATFWSSVGFAMYCKLKRSGGRRTGWSSSPG